MEFNSLNFFSFFIIFFFIYYILSNRVVAQNMLLLIASLFFYATLGWEVTISLIAVVLISYSVIFAVSFFKSRDKGLYAKIFATLGCLMAVGYLGYFKYFNFFGTEMANLCHALGWEFGFVERELFLPLGMSFYTFKVISATVDVYKGKIQIPSFLDYSNYILFFPTIASGPIDRPDKFLSQLLSPRRFNYNKACDGTLQILYGVFKKMVIADNLSIVTNEYFDNYANIGSGLALLWGVALYTIQLYADFSGYSDMAIGISKLLSFDVMPNFRYPLFARNISEFWKRWHISLTSWLTNYIYIPLGGNRKGKKRKLLNVFCVFIVSGLWHGAGWNYIVWGGGHGVAMNTLNLIGGNRYKGTICEKSIFPSIKEVFGIAITFLFVSSLFTLFRLNSFSEFISYFTAIFSNPWTLAWVDVRYIVFILMMLAFDWYGRFSEHPLLSFKNRWIRYLIYGILIFTIVYHQGQSSDFIYFEF